MAITTLSMVLTVCILNLHHITDKPVPLCLQTIVFRHIARLLCMHKHTRMPRSDAQACASRKRQLSRFMAPQLLRNVNGVASDEDVCDAKNTHFRRQLSLESDDDVSDTEESDKKAREERFAREWRQVAEVMDRLFFWFFFLSIVVSTLVLFHPLTVAFLSNRSPVPPPR